MNYDHAQADDIVARLFTPQGRADPYPLYHQLRAIAPTHRSDVAHAWVLTAYDDCPATRTAGLRRTWCTRRSS